MIELTAKNIRLGVRARTKEEAIRAAGGVLVESACIAPGYVESMLGRELQANTYLGNGIAIPHGMAADRELIRLTSVSVVQAPEGVEWNPGQTVRLIVGIAARSDEHLGVLAALTDVLDDPALAEALARTGDPQAIIDALTRNRDEKAVSETPVAGGEFVDAKIVGQAGLHARPAAVFVEAAGRFKSEIRVQNGGGKSVNGKSMASLLKLGAEAGTTLRIFADGPDALQALAALKAAVESGLGDSDEAPHADGAASLDLPIWTPQSAGHAIGGVAASPGLAIGAVFQFQNAQVIVTDESKGIESERAALRSALEIAVEQLSDIHRAASERLGKGEAAIFLAHKAFLTSDEDLILDVNARIGSGHSAARAWKTAIDARVADMQLVQNERLAGRAADLHDVGQRVLRLLAGVENGALQLPQEPVILIADDLSPSDTARLDPRRILGLCTASGGPTSHTAIIARSLDIPAIVGAGAAVLELASGPLCILDGITGQLYVEPSTADLDSAALFQADLRARRDKEFQARYEPAMLTDGHRVEVVANIGKAAEAALAVEAGAEGVGLMRTEFLFLGRETPPSEDEQFAAYRQMIEALNGLPLIIRTLDIGGDKAVPYLSMPHEDNPFLGVRGIRLCLHRPELFLPQLRAIYRAAALGPVKMMFPMVADLADLRAAVILAEEVRLELGAAPVEIGIMIEVPSAALMADELAQEVDFFSIGTNDLTQYTLAIDRLHPLLGKVVDGLHPAVLRLIQLTVQGAQRHGKWVGVCGGVAGDPLGAAILTGLGVKELSMSLPSIAAVKASLRRMSFKDAKALAQKALACRIADEVRQLSIL
jgi:phosphoenolpyruvate-protein phosphotransferase